MEGIQSSTAGKGHFRALSAPSLPTVRFFILPFLPVQLPYFLEKLSLAQAVISLSMTLLGPRAHSLGSKSLTCPLLLDKPQTQPTRHCPFHPLRSLARSSCCRALGSPGHRCAQGLPRHTVPRKSHLLSVPPVHEHIHLSIRNNGFCFSPGYENKSLPCKQLENTK